MHFPIANISSFIPSTCFSKSRRIGGCQLAVLNYGKPLSCTWFSRHEVGTNYERIDVRLPVVKLCQVLLGEMLYSSPHLDGKSLR